MSSSVAEGSPECHRVIPEIRRRVLKASLRKAENTEMQAEIGACLDFARREIGWTLDQLAGELRRDARQVRRWIDGTERTQVDVVFSVEVLRAPFVEALARLSGAFEVTRTLKRRIA